ncbi:glycoside hydrolase family 15 protein [Thermomicrobiaceae bacterium CFH 74404]|uniref:Glycoside hydrolase family 15 protein n=1 Tax=Thermalbibacter longus TaxID=2951981 RepID=A0AA41WIY7_9BACT|nr:glycoside hydrolase family 15 protein [Thermalbibacter longus]MCM8750231.1 glycoside hydrolase family 15 protein [Thermalbibacter longus]
MSTSPTRQTKETAAPDTRYPPISDYGAIGDGRSIALVSRRGSVDWWCLPRFDSDPVFARLLDADLGGYFAIEPLEPAETRRRYRPDTNILETEFHTASGRVLIVDFMPALTERQKKIFPVPYRMLVRRLRCHAGRVTLRITVRLRPSFGRRTPDVQRLQPAWYSIGWADQLCILYSQVPLEIRGGTLTGSITLEQGQRLDLALAYSPEAPAELPIPQHFDLLERLTEDFWCTWVGHCWYRGPYRDAVIRSALALKLMIYAPSGAIIAAPTTSLPEYIGGVRNWDYRYCWLRDAAFTVRVLLNLGFHREADAFVDWLLHATRLTHPELQVVYSIYGETHLPERLLTDLEGYRGSRPVRVGNDASRQFQLDVYGEVLDALAIYRRTGRPLERDDHTLIRGLASVIMRRWQEPDDGIWEVRSGRAHHVHSKAMCAVGLRRVRELARLDGFSIPEGEIARTEAAIEDWILRHGYDPELGAFVSVPGRGLDAALLVLALIDCFLSPRDPRVVGTVEAIARYLARGELVYRYLREDGLPGPEGAFVICSFWLAAALARIGQLERAFEHFERLLQRANDLGLLAEEIDPASGEQLGNFPQAFSHIGLIDTALALEELSGRERLPVSVAAS